MKGIDIFVSAVLNAVLLQFTTDESPKDNNITLAGYDAQIIDDESELTFWEKVVKFFESLMQYICRFFGFGK